MNDKIQNELNKTRDIIVKTVPAEQIYLFIWFLRLWCAGQGQ
jgi:hypothetical protein